MRLKIRRFSGHDKEEGLVNFLIDIIEHCSSHDIPGG